MVNLQQYDITKACVFDTETTYNTYLGRAGSPFSDGSISLCSAGFLFPTGYRDSYLVTKHIDGIKRGVGRGSPEWYSSFPDLDGVDVLVGHNIKFDLLWYWRHPKLEAFLKRGGRVWCTLYAEYLLSGQFYSIDQLPHLRPTLKNVAIRRGCTHKLDVVAALWEKGVRTEDIQEQILLEYQQGDCQTAKEIYEDQIAQALRQKQLHMIHHRMDGLLATTEMEYNGLFIDVEEAERRLEELSAEADERFEALNKYIPEGLPAALEFNWNSDAHLSALLFGGSIKYRDDAVKTNPDGSLQYYKKTVKVPVMKNGTHCKYVSGLNKGQLKYKNAQVDDIERGPKTRKEDFYWPLPRQAVPKAAWKNKKSKEQELPDEQAQYSVSADVLEEVAEQDVALVHDLLALRALQKDIGTYYRRFFKGKWTGMLTMVGEDQIIHHNLNHALTKTSRLSSSKPNLQNLSGKGKSQVRKMFISRFGQDGVVIEGDYSQLEVVCKAVLCKDPELRRKLIIGLCLHCDWLALSPMAEGKSYEEVYRLCKIEHDAEWTAKRKKIKPVTFGEAYGAGITKLCQSSGLTADIIEEAIAKRKLTYPLMYKYDDDNIAKVQASRQLSTVKTQSGQRAGIGYVRTDTDTVYHFLETDSPDWKQRQGVMTSFTPTIIKNYPSQGLGGEIMQVQAGRVFRWLLANDRFDDKFLLTNTVHDCAWADVHKDAIQHVQTMKEIMEDVCDFFNANYPGVDWDIPFPTEFEAGPSMYELEVMHFD